MLVILGVLQVWCRKKYNDYASNVQNGTFPVVKITGCMTDEQLDVYITSQNDHYKVPHKQKEIGEC